VTDSTAVSERLPESGYVQFASRRVRLADKATRPRHTQLDVRQRIAVSLGLVATGGVLVAAGAIGAHWSTGQLPGTLIGVGMLAGAAVVLQLRAALRAQDRENACHAAELAQARAEHASTERQALGRLHDARSIALALMGASRQLARPDGPSADQAARLIEMMNAELRRLQGVLPGDATEPISQFNLNEALSPVILAHCLTGAPVQVAVPDVQVVGRPGATATVVANLLANARTHAPGATVTVRAEASTDIVSLVVEDDGPGIPALERARVLQFGTRGSSASGAGSGIGLYTAAARMTDQAGTLQVAERDGGGTCLVLTLPAAS
jgi:signal transduction histidine kinase